jgi:phosphoribosyl-AMP cyclohydrolase
VDGWMGVKAVLRIAYSNQKKFEKTLTIKMKVSTGRMDEWMDGWMDGSMDGWMDVKSVLKIAIKITRKTC